MTIKEAMSKILEKHGKLQVNLASGTARRQIVLEIEKLVVLR